MEFKIRKAGFIDVVPIFGIMSKISEETQGSDIFVGDDLAYVNNHIRLDGVTYVAQIGGDAAGFIIVDIPGERPHNMGHDISLPYRRLFSVAHMDSIAVLPQYRGMGIQKALLKHAEGEMAALGYTDFFATVHPENAASLKSFIAMGYEIQATKPKYGDLIRHILHKRPD